MYLGGVPGESASPYAAAARAESLAGLPPTYVGVGTEDLFRDEDIDYVRRLIADDVACELAVFPGVYHAAESFVPGAAVSRRFNASILAAIHNGLDAS